MSQFIGRGENLTEHIIGRLFPGAEIKGQWPIQKIMTPKEWGELDEIYQKHKFDFIVTLPDERLLVIEVNYKHGEGAARKWANIFTKILKEYGVMPITIDDYDTRSLFKQNGKGEHKKTWDDFRDIIDAFEKAGVKP